MAEARCIQILYTHSLYKRGVTILRKKATATLFLCTRSASTPGTKVFAIQLSLHWEEALPFSHRSAASVLDQVMTMSTTHSFRAFYAPYSL